MEHDTGFINKIGINNKIWHIKDTLGYKILLKYHYWNDVIIIIFYVAGYMNTILESFWNVRTFNNIK